MTVNRLKTCITNTVINYYNYQVGRKPSKASKAGLEPIATNLRERDAYQDFDKLSILVKQISMHLYENRDLHLRCLLTIFKAIQDVIESPTDSIEIQAQSIKSFLERYFLSIITLYSSDSDIQLNESITLNTLKAYAYGVSTGTSSFGTTLEECMLHPFNLNKLSHEDDVKYISEKISQDLVGIVRRSIKGQDLNKEQQDGSLIQENKSLKQQIAAKDETIKEKDETIEKQAEEIANLKKQSGPAQISFADAFTTFSKEPEVTSKKQTNSISEFSL